MTSREETLSKLRALAASTTNDHERAAVLAAIEKLDVVDSAGETTVRLAESGDGFEEFRILNAMAIVADAVVRPGCRVVVAGVGVTTGLAGNGRRVVREFLELRSTLRCLRADEKAAIADALFAIGKMQEHSTVEQVSRMVGRLVR